MEHTDITIEGSIATWQMPITEGEVLGTYSGSWRFKCYLTPTEQLQAGRQYRELLGPNAGLANDTESNLSFALVQLKHRVISAPPFWTSASQNSGMAGDIPDLNIIALVLDKAIQAEQLFKERIAKERELLLEKSIKKAEEIQQKGQ